MDKSWIWAGIGVILMTLLLGVVGLVIALVIVGVWLGRRTRSSKGGHDG
mgnify:FL=1